MTCRPCELAELNPASTHFRSGCRWCSARALAHAPDYLGRAQLEPVFGAAWRAAASEVQAWRTRIAQACLNPATDLSAGRDHLLGCPDCDHGIRGGKPCQSCAGPRQGGANDDRK